MSKKLSLLWLEDDAPTAQEYQKKIKEHLPHVEIHVVSKIATLSGKLQDYYDKQQQEPNVVIKPDAIILDCMIKGARSLRLLGEGLSHIDTQLGHDAGLMIYKHYFRNANGYVEKWIADFWQNVPILVYSTLTLEEMKSIMGDFSVKIPDMLLSKAAVWQKPREAHFADIINWIKNPRSILTY